MRTTATISDHPFTWSGELRQGPIGRPSKVCATCGATRPAHRQRWAPGSRRRSQAPGGARAPLTDSPVRPPEPAPEPPPPIEREVLALILALDTILAEPPDTLPVAAWVRARELRNALPVPRWEPLAKPPRRPRLAAVPPPAAPALEEANADREGWPRGGGAWGNGTAGAAPRADRVDPTMARARQATKGIRNDRMRALAARAVAEGWQPRKTGDGHLRLDPPGGTGAPIVLSLTATAAGRGWANAKADAKRRGLDVTGL